jgi:dolichyl-phosphate-mannose--protein O-mannosyl transferase
MNRWLAADLGRISFARLAPWLIILLAAVLRLFNLGYPKKLVFDETYYVKDAWTLWNTGSEKAWPADANPLFEAGNSNIFLNDPSYVVHPPLGKWIIGFGMWLFGPENPFSWRVSVAILSIASVGLLMVVAKMLLKSTLWAVVAGFLLAIDGTAIVMGRTGLLDSMLMFFVLLAFYFLLRDIQNRDLSKLVWQRPWLLAAGVALGAATSVKWSGLYFLAAFGLYVVISEALARRDAGQKHWALVGIVANGAIAFALMVPTALLTYLASWTGWLVTSGGYGRAWAEDSANAATGFWSFMPTSLQSLWHYHQSAYGFHVGLSTPHSYSSNALTWLISLRPTSFFYEGLSEGQNGCITAGGCSSAITSLGNPVIWISATLALLAMIALWILKKDRIAGLILLGVLAGYVPWLFFMNRTVFSFYSIAFLPWMILAVVYAIKLIWNSLPTSKRSLGQTIIAGYLTLIFGVSLFFLPIWFGTWIPFWYWQIHMWIPSWI